MTATNAIMPLVKKFEIVQQQADQLSGIIDRCDDFMRLNPIKACPLCAAGEHVALTHWQHPNPEHSDFAVLIKCDNCRIQTMPEYWFINTPETALKALKAAYASWNNRPTEKVLP